VDKNIQVQLCQVVSVFARWWRHS